LVEAKRRCRCGSPWLCYSCSLECNRRHWNQIKIVIVFFELNLIYRFASCFDKNISNKKTTIQQFNSIQERKNKIDYTLKWQQLKNCKWRAFYDWTILFLFYFLFFLLYKSLQVQRTWANLRQLKCFGDLPSPSLIICDKVQSDTRDFYQLSNAHRFTCNALAVIEPF
jgi:hypothetical protein